MNETPPPDPVPSTPPAAPAPRRGRRLLVALAVLVVLAVAAVLGSAPLRAKHVSGEEARTTLNIVLNLAQASYLEQVDVGNADAPAPSWATLSADDIAVGPPLDSRDGSKFTLVKTRGLGGDCNQGAAERTDVGEIAFCVNEERIALATTDSDGTLWTAGRLTGAEEEQANKHGRF